MAILSILLSNPSLLCPCVSFRLSFPATNSLSFICSLIYFRPFVFPYFFCTHPVLSFVFLSVLSFSFQLMFLSRATRPVSHRFGLSVRPSVRPFVRPSLRPFVGPSHFTFFAFLGILRVGKFVFKFAPAQIMTAPAQIITAPAQIITAPAQPPATGAVVYTALFGFLGALTAITCEMVLTTILVLTILHVTLERPKSKIASISKLPLILGVRVGQLTMAFL